MDAIGALLRTTIWTPPAALMLVACAAFDPHDRSGRVTSDAGATLGPGVSMDAAVSMDSEPLAEPDASTSTLRDGSNDSSSPQDAGALSCRAAFEAFKERIDDNLAGECCSAEPLSLACTCSIATCPSLADAIGSVQVPQSEPPYPARCGCGTVAIGLGPGVVRVYSLVTHELVGMSLSNDLAFGPCETHSYRAGVLDNDCEDRRPCSAADVLGACAPPDRDD